MTSNDLPPPDQTSSRRPAARWFDGWLMAVALGLVYYAIAVGAMWNKSPTADEPVHVLAGYTYNRFGDFRINPENGNLPQRLAGLSPLVFSQREVPTSNEAWRLGLPAPIVDDWFYAKGDLAAMNDVRAIERGGRMIIAVLGLITVLLAYGWARSLFGPAGGLIAAVLTAFCPNMLAHGGQTTSDMAATASFTGTLWALAAVYGKPSPFRIALAGVALGLSAASKFSVVLFFPLLALFTLAYAFCSTDLTVRGFRSSHTYRCGRRKLAVLLATTALVALAAYGTLWAFFDFHFHAAAVGNTDPNLYVNRIEKAAQSMGRAGELLRLPLRLHLLPESYYAGFLKVMKYSRIRDAYFFGEYSDTGWPQFFPVTTLMKTPIGTLLLWPIGLIAAVAISLRTAPAHRRWRSAFLALLPIYSFLAIYWLTAVTSHLNIGHRHMLVIYPSLAVLVGSLAMVRWRRRWVMSGVGALLAWNVVEAIAWFPDYIPYTNVAVGRRAYRYLADSNIDWGQDLPAVARWIERERATNPASHIYLGYFGDGYPPAEGIRDVIELPSAFFQSGAIHANPEPLAGGVYILGATVWSQVYGGVARGHWNPVYEADYQRFRAIIGRETDRDRLLALLGDRAENYERLRLGRLCAYLRVRREPDEVLHRSTLVFRLSDAEVAEALDGPPAELRASEGNYSAPEGARVRGVTGPATAPVRTMP